MTWFSSSWPGSSQHTSHSFLETCLRIQRHTPLPTESFFFFFFNVQDVWLSTIQTSRPWEHGSHVTAVSAKCLPYNWRTEAPAPLLNPFPRVTQAHWRTKLPRIWEQGSGNGSASRVLATKCEDSILILRTHIKNKTEKNLSSRPAWSGSLAYLVSYEPVRDYLKKTTADGVRELAQ